MEEEHKEQEVKKKRGAPKGLRYGGRQKGTKNKVANPLRARIAKFLEDKWEEAEKAWESIEEPKDKVKLYIDLAAYVMPKLQSVQLEADVKSTNSVQEDLIMLSKDVNN